MVVIAIPAVYVGHGASREMEGSVARKARREESRIRHGQVDAIIAAAVGVITGAEVGGILWERFGREREDIIGAYVAYQTFVSRLILF